MPERSTIADTSCLIGLEAINRLDLLEQQFGEIVIPEAVAAEWSLSLPAWIQVELVQNQALVQALRDRLGAGESEVIAYAVERAAQRVILDDRRARRNAQQFKLPITGTVGVILRAKECGLLATVEPVLDDLSRTGFTISDGLRREALRLAGE